MFDDSAEDMVRAGRASIYGLLESGNVVPNYHEETWKVWCDEHEGERGYEHEMKSSEIEQEVLFCRLKI